MNKYLLTPLLLAAGLSLAQAEEKSLTEKTKDVGRAIVSTTKKGVDTMVDALTPDSDARKVEVKLSEHHLDMPRRLESGKTAFVVRNEGKEKHNFEIVGEGIDKKFLAGVEPNESRVLHVDLKRGSYRVICPMKDHASEGMKLDLIVK